ncbi:acyl-CoA N-acyltransferase [Coprinellus micaceus]|uniref:Acyl-CoA N-acyltransferase n=1 Tax=Coprinellus micaceus TaxID=71717 RepID=A0A4Y7TJJ5_COPMI|nr:acyl-CoA N-acyltransferase [Coprinellus micaceus]
MSSSYHIRPARPEDVHVILALITDLAIYEKEPDAVKATPELLRKNLFGESPCAHALLAFTGSADVKGEAVGLALYFFNYSTWTGKPGLYLEDLYVKQDQRSLGVGKALFRELGRVAEDKGCSRMDWVVLTWNQPSIDFYEKRLGAKRMSDWVGMRLEEAGIADLRNLV